MKKLLLFVLILCATVTTYAQSIMYNNIYYNITSPTTVEVGQNAGFKGDAVIPSTVSYENVTYTVSRIGNNAFKCNDAITSIVIPKTVTSIGAGAFDFCIWLNSISIDWDSPLAINEGLFSSCDDRTTLYVPKGVQAAYKADPVWKKFYNIVEGILPKTFTISGINYIVNSPSTVSVGYNPKIIGDVVIPSNVTDAGTTYTVTGIQYYAFCFSSSLTSLVIPKSVTSIGEGAFVSCFALNFLTVDWDTPLNINPNVFESVSIGSIYLYIPKGKLSEYKATPVWKDFGNIADGATPLALNVSGINYTVTGLATVAVALNSNFTGSANIPNTVTHLGINYLVSSIVNNAFANCSKLSDVTIPNTVKTIGNNAFSNCEILKSVVIPNSVTSIGNSAFNSCKVLTSVIIPNSVQSIGDNAFENCTGLITASIGNSLKTIGSKAFSGCSSLTSLSLPNSVTNIGASAFEYCHRLSSINIPNLLSIIEVRTFARCDVLSSIIIPNSVTIINESAFGGCSGLKIVNMSNSVTSIGMYSFYGCTNLTSVNFPNSLTTIGEGAFGNCISIKSIIIPNSVINIDGGAFNGCSSLTSVSIPNSVIKIGGAAFGYCTGLKSVTLPNSLNSIERSTFSSCTSLTSIIIPNSVVKIDESAFYYCSALSSINMPNSLTEIGLQTFYKCASLKSINIPNSVTKIGGAAFYDCKNLESVNIPSSLTTIEDHTFYNCGRLRSINIPKSITSIGMGVFSCEFGFRRYLETVTVNSTTPLALSPFEFSATFMNLATLYVPAGTKGAYQSATIWKDFGTIIEMQTFTSNGINYTVASPSTIEITANPSFTGMLNIPSSVIYDGTTYDVASIANNAFAGTGITSINIPNSIINIGNYAFANCTGLTTVTVNWTTPLVINGNVFGEVPVVLANTLSKTLNINNSKVVTLASTNISNVTLNVPSSTFAAYKATAVWQDFGTIIEESVLPLTLTSLTAKAIATGNQINWSTANIVNVKNIILERSGSDNNFNYLTTLPITATQFIDFNPLASDNYYRLSTIDNDGSTKTYPQIAFVKGLTNGVSFYPNPVTNGVLNVVAGDAKLQSVALFDLNGKRVVLINNFNNNKNVAVNTQGLEKGVFLLEISSEKSKLVKKVVVN